MLEGRGLLSTPEVVSIGVRKEEMTPIIGCSEWESEKERERERTPSVGCFEWESLGGKLKCKGRFTENVWGTRSVSLAGGDLNWRVRKRDDGNRRLFGMWETLGDVNPRLVYGAHVRPTMLEPLLTLGEIQSRERLAIPCLRRLAGLLDCLHNFRVLLVFCIGDEFANFSFNFLQTLIIEWVLMMIGIGGRIRISPNGQCTPMAENGEASEGIRDLPRTNNLDTEPVRTRSGRLKLGYFKHSLEDIITDAFLWLMRQSKGKHIKASKVSTNFQIRLLINFYTPFQVFWNDFISINTHYQPYNFWHGRR